MEFLSSVTALGTKVSVVPVKKIKIKQAFYNFLYLCVVSKVWHCFILKSWLFKWVCLVGIFCICFGKQVSLTNWAVQDALTIYGNKRWITCEPTSKLWRKNTLWLQLDGTCRWARTVHQVSMVVLRVLSSVIFKWLGGYLEIAMKWALLWVEGLGRWRYCLIRSLRIVWWHLLKLRLRRHHG